MKITLEPSGEDSQNYPTLTGDLRTNDETTTEAVTLALALIVNYGHHPQNVADAAGMWADENAPTQQSND